MIDRVLAKVFGTQHERDIKKLLPRVQRINALEPSIKALSDEALRARPRSSARGLPRPWKECPKRI
jgi:preprotein translocase subunit SecA